MFKNVRDIALGPRLLLRGLRLLLRTPRLLMLGALPAIVTTIVLLAAIVGLLFVVGDLVTWATPFADDWSDGVRQAARFAIGAALVGGALVIAVIMFATVTLAIGSPFYERVASGVDDRLGAVPVVESAPVNRLAELVRPILTSLGAAALLFVLGLVPVAGTVVVGVTSAVVAANLLSVELTETAFSARGLDLDARRRALRKRPVLVLSFGVPVYLLCLVPLLAIIAMPAAVAGGTLVAREVLGEPTGN